MLVKDDDIEQTLQTVLASVQNFLQLRDQFRTGPVRLEADRDANDAGVHQVEAALGMLRQRMGEVAHFHFRGRKRGCTRTPFPPAAEPQNGDADQRNECRGPYWQTGQAIFVRGSAHLAVILRKMQTLPSTSYLSLKPIQRNGARVRQIVRNFTEIMQNKLGKIVAAATRDSPGAGSSEPGYSFDETSMPQLRVHDTGHN